MASHNTVLTWTLSAFMLMTPACSSRERPEARPVQSAVVETELGKAPAWHGEIEKRAERRQNLLMYGILRNDVDTTHAVLDFYGVPDSIDVDAETVVFRYSSGGRRTVYLHFTLLDGKLCAVLMDL